jgi:hypothetical protein
MAKLLRLNDIPTTRARDAERRARAKYADRAAALEAAPYEVVDAAGCYSGAYPDAYGWLCSADAAEAVAAEVTRMPGGTQHCARAVKGPRR